MRKIIIPLFISTLSSAATYAQIRDIDPATDQYFEISKNIEIYTNIFKELNKGYVDPIQPGSMMKAGVDAMLQKLDPYTNFYTETDKQDQDFNAMGKYGGIGTGITIIDSMIFVGEIYEQSPAHKAGLQSGDRIMTINDIPVTGKTDDELSLLLRGAPGTKVTMEIISRVSKSPVQKVIQREAIEVKSVPLYKLVGKNKDLAYVYLQQFTANCAADIEQALNKMKDENPNMKGVILDLRNNPGGLLHEAVKICNLFLPKGKTVVTTRGKGKNQLSELKTENNPWNDQIPLAILINNGSASASEVVSGTIQDYDRGVIIGAKSFGKGLVQNVVPLGYNTYLKLTTAKYYTPSGRCIQTIDYSHKNADGSVSNVPDSLKKAFKTVAGRTVYDGGGIDPDVITTDMNVNRTLILLMNDGKIFDYANDYFYNHKTIKPAEEFMISNGEFEDFVKLIDKSDYSYKSPSEEVTKVLKDVLEKDNYLAQTQTALDALNRSIKEAKKKSILDNKEQLKKLISNEIVGRYYYQNGKALHRISNNDLELIEAERLLLNPTGRYSDILRK